MRAAVLAAARVGFECGRLRVDAVFAQSTSGALEASEGPSLRVRPGSVVRDSMHCLSACARALWAHRATSVHRSDAICMRIVCICCLGPALAMGLAPGMVAPYARSPPCMVAKLLRKGNHRTSHADACAAEPAVAEWAVAEWDASDEGDVVRAAQAGNKGGGDESVTRLSEGWASSMARSGRRGHTVKGALRRTSREAYQMFEQAESQPQPVDFGILRGR